MSTSEKKTEGEAQKQEEEDNLLDLTMKLAGND